MKTAATLNWKVRGDSANTSQFFANILSTAESKLEHADNSVLVANIPLFVSKVNVKQVFESFGEISSIDLLQNSILPNKDSRNGVYPLKETTRGFSVAHIAFKHCKPIGQIQEFLASTETKPFVVGADNSGINGMVGFYGSRIENEKCLEASSDEFMRKYENQVLQETERKSSGLNEDGWISVIRKGNRRLGAARTEKLQNILRGKKEKWEKRLLNFTPTHIKESRAKHLAELKKKFEEDKQRLSLIKQQRKFRPF